MSSTVDDPNNPLAQERDAKFKKWLQNKAIKEKAFEYLAKLDPSRASYDDKLIDVGVAMCAIERMLGEDEDQNKNSQKDDEGLSPLELLRATSAGKKTEVKSTSAKKTLKSAWIKWSTEFHSFSMLILTDSDLSQISDAVKEYLFSEADIVASSGASSEEISKADKKKNILPSLKYFFPTVPKPGEKPRPLTNDQKVQNTIYMRELRKMWRKAKEELDNRVVEYVAKKMKTGGAGGREAMEKEMKSKAVEESSPSDNSVKPANLAKFYESQCLNELSLKQLRLWIEEDEDEKITSQNESAAEKIREAKRSHEQFVKKKDSLRIRMPEGEVVVPKTAAMTYGREFTGVRATGKSISSTVELMAGSGLKFVHATSKGRKGVEGDLEKSRNKLLKQGFVAKENFDEEEKDLYLKEKRENKVLVEKKQLEEKTKEDNAKAYEEWLLLKEMRDQAGKCLGLMQKPVLPLDEEDLYQPARKSTASLDLQQTKSRLAFNALNLRNPDHRDVFDEIVDVGKNLKKVDRTLFAEWAKWADGVIPIGVATTLWDYFPPMACDVHSAAFSQVRDSFLKLLRPGVDYRETFMQFVEKHVFARRIRETGGEEDPETLEALRKEWLQDVSLNKHQFKSLLLQLGVALKDAEMRTLIDAFDSNGDGVITLPEFLDFIGPKRDRKAGSSLVLNQRCCWLTTCRVTGMPNGYSVSNPTKRFLRQEEETKRKESSSNTKLFRPRDSEDSKHNDEELSKTNQANFTGNFVVRKLANGEKRMCIELLDRIRREEMLRKLHLLEDDKHHRADEERGKKRDDDEHNYHDDYEEDDPYADDDDHDKHSKDHHAKAATGSRASLEGSKGGVAVIGACDYCTWSAKERREGLKYLMAVTRDAREEELLKTMLTKGTPPSAPNFWIKFEKSLETKSKNRLATLRSNKSRARSPNEDGDEYEEDQDDFQEDEEGGEQGHSSNELTLLWSPSKPTDLVSFYSIEFAGAVTLNTKLGDAKYVEVFRDPEDADMGSNFSFCYNMTDLQPGTTYRFRIRAFNGFGPGEYTYKSFTTMTTAPLQPRIIKIAPESVTLRWTFSEGFFKRMEELKKIFTLADKDKSGVVSREELNAALDEQASSMKGLRSFLDKVAASKGLDLSQGYGALFDMIEGDDDNGLSWQEFEVFFLSAGWSSGATNTGSGMLASQNVRKSTASFGTMNSATSASGGNKVAIKPGDIVYVVERCESEFEDIYKETLRTNAGQGTLTRLEPGKSYRFRVYSINADNVRGPCSPAITVHTLLETPAAPTTVAKGVLARSIALTWKPRNVVTNSRDKAFVDRMLGDWTHSHGDNEAGVSIESAFAKYDKNQSGDIDAAELACVLEDLGVEVTDERLSQAFAQLDINGDGVISFAEFGKWWRADSVTYVVKRSEEIVPLNRQAALMNGTNSENNSVNGDAAKPRTASRGRMGSRPASATMMTPIPEEGSMHGSVQGSTAGRAVSRGRIAGSVSGGNNPLGGGRQVAVPVVVYRDTKTRFDVKGLTPNSAYHFKVRYVGSRSNSMLSPPLAIMTAPLAPSAPVPIEVTSNTVRVKWYAPEFGAYKFVVHMRQVLSNTSMRRTAAPIVGVDLKDEGWFNVYNGPDNIFTCTTLSSDAAYEIRVFAANYQGNLSEASPSITFTTLQRNDAGNVLTAKNAGDFFTVECTGDICVGDTILITERLFLKPKPGEVTETASRTLKAATATNTKARRSTEANNNGGLDSNNRMNMSVTSITDNDGISITAAHGAFIGERTIAAFVSRDNYRTTRDLLAQKNLNPQDREFGAYRKLWLEVVWQRGSTEACKKYEVKPGEVLERIQSHLEQFEVFRTKWRQEGLRRPLSNEWASLRDCYIDASL